jgi:pregnancy-associated plasma protein-A
MRGSFRRRRYQLLAVFALALAVTTSMSVSPAAAGSATLAGPAVFCDDSASIFSSMARLTPSSTARAGDRLAEKSTRDIVADSQIPKGEEPRTSSSFTATIPVYFHVVAASRDPADGWISNKQVRDQIGVLNNTFAGGRGGADTGFRFVLAGTTRTVNADWFAQETFADEVDMKSALKQGDATTLNIYSTSGGGFLGWAYYPKIVVYQQLQVLDGVVIHFGSVPGGSIPRFNLGFTATHEVGHWLGLAHTFEDGCQGHGDFIDDTPAEAAPTSRCPIGKDTCPEAGLDPIHNYMDYSDDACYTEFTADQADRTHEQYVHWRVEHGY